MRVLAEGRQPVSGEPVVQHRVPRRRGREEPRRLTLAILGGRKAPLLGGRPEGVVGDRPGEKKRELGCGLVVREVNFTARPGCGIERTDFFAI
jgi:hypothetical protein